MKTNKESMYKTAECSECFAPAVGYWVATQRNLVPLCELCASAFGVVAIPFSAIINAVTCHSALMREHEDGECYCLPMDEGGRDNALCPWCEVNAIKNARARAAERIPTAEGRPE